MNVRHRAAIAMAVIVGGIAGCAYGVLVGSIPVLMVSMVSFALGFVYGHRLVYGLPDGGPDTDDADMPGLPGDGTDTGE